MYNLSLSGTAGFVFLVSMLLLHHFEVHLPRYLGSAESSFCNNKLYLRTKTHRVATLEVNLKLEKDCSN